MKNYFKTIYLTHINENNLQRNKNKKTFKEYNKQL